MSLGKSGRGDKEKERMGLLPRVIESASSRTTLDEVLHVGEGGRPREVAQKRNSKERERERESARE